MNNFLLAQTAGTIAVIFSLIVYQFDDRRKMLILDLISNLFWIITFLQLKASTGLSMVIIGALASLSFIKYSPTRKNLWLLALIISTILLATIITWDGPVSLLAMLGSILYTIRFWTRNTTRIRRMSLIAAPPWLIYDLITLNYPGVFIEVFGIISNFIGQYRFDLTREYPK